MSEHRRRSALGTPQARRLMETNAALQTEIKRLRAALKCERESGDCVMVHDPERPPCTAENCDTVRALTEG
jgi:hypothetical protein